jgi:multicomponent K+:H+ antiporter subunit A
VLAYSTIGHLGLITLLLGMSTELALIAAVFHMLNHATFKASLFMATGVVDHETGTRDLGRLSGLRHAMPITATLAAVAAGAMAGVPLLNGFLSKEMFFEESIAVGGSVGMQLLLPAIATLGGLFSVAYSLRFIHQVFFGPPARDLPRTPHEPRLMLVPSALLVVTCVLVGVLPGETIGPAALDGRHGDSRRVPEYELAVWHGFTPALLMSLVALAGGVSFYTLLYRKGQTLVATPLLSRVDSKRIFDIANVAVTRAAGRATRRLFSRRLQAQLVLIVASAVRRRRAAAIDGRLARARTQAHSARSRVRGAVDRRRPHARSALRGRRSFTASPRSSWSAAPGSSCAHLRLALRAGFGADANRGRGRDDGAVRARPALAAATARARRHAQAQRSAQSAARA